MLCMVSEAAKVTCVRPPSNARSTRSEIVRQPQLTQGCTHLLYLLFRGTFRRYVEAHGNR